jgi:NADH dehydrogenase [ubiquinone] 1 alpha subcomplex assembly factor 7
MSEVLTNATAGYYTRRDVFGTAGDFITSPEISQMYGEMMGIWCVAMWQQLESPPALRLVELGPGRGTLMADLLRGTATFSSFASSLSVSMVEVSPVLRKMQWKALWCQGEYPDEDEKTTTSITGTTAAGISVTWYRSLEEVPEDHTAFYIAHEFFDALPVHQFQNSPERGWCERLVDVAPPESPYHFRMVLSPGPTPASRTLLPLRFKGLTVTQRAALNAIEICPQGMATAEALGRRVAAHGGAALLIDYGQNGPYKGSLQAIKDHKFVGLFNSPGDADLSAWVDFGALRTAVESTSGVNAKVHGPISQANLLHSLGIQARLQQLVDNASTEEEAEGLIKGYRRLVGSGSSNSTNEDDGGGGANGGSSEHSEKEEDSEELDGMGESYQAICIAPPMIQKNGGDVEFKPVCF